MGNDSLIYSFVARGSVVLTEYTAFSGNFSTIAVQCLQKLPPDRGKLTYSCDGHTFNFLIDDGFTYLVVADESVGRQAPFAFLERVKDDFKQRYGGARANSPFSDSLDNDYEDMFNVSYCLDKEFGPKIKDHMQYCVDHPEEMNKIAKIKAQVSEVKGIMIENIEKVLDRGERIALLVDKTENLQLQADRFQRHGRQLRRKMWLQGLKMKLTVAGILFLFILIVWLSICHGFRCK